MTSKHRANTGLYALVTRRSTGITHAASRRENYLYTNCGTSFKVDSAVADVEFVDTARKLLERATCQRCKA